MAENQTNEPSEYIKRIKEISTKMNEDLKKSVEQFQETRKEILSAMFLTILVSLFLNLFSSFFADYLKTNSSISLYGFFFSGILSVIFFIVWIHLFKSFKPIYSPQVFTEIHLSELHDKAVQDVLRKMRENEVQVDESKLCKDLFNYIKNEAKITGLVILPELKENTLRWTIAQKPKIIFEVFPIPLPTFYYNVEEKNLEIGYTHDIQLILQVSIEDPTNPRTGEILKSLSVLLYAVCATIIESMTYVLLSYAKSTQK